MQEDVSFDDQRKINTFSRLNLKIKELEAQLASKRRAAEDYEEAENELMLLEEETVPYVVGECLVHLPKESVEERLQKCRIRLFCSQLPLANHCGNKLTNLLLVIHKFIIVSCSARRNKGGSFRITGED